MKKNSLKKLIKEVIVEYKKETEIPVEEYKAKPYYTAPQYMDVKEPYTDDYNETDVEISKKFCNFIISLSKKDQCHISTDPSRILFTYRLPNGDVMDIGVNKGMGFTIQTHRIGVIGSLSSQSAFGENIKFKDTEMFDKIFTKIDIIRKQRIVETFNDKIDELFISCGLSRENNLDELLNDENNEAEC